MGANLISKYNILNLTNQQTRIQFLEDYQKWNKVLEVPELKQSYYACQLPNNKYIIVREEQAFTIDEFLEFRNRTMSTFFLAREWGGAKFDDFRISEAALVNELKVLRKQITGEIE